MVNSLKVCFLILPCLVLASPVWSQAMKDLDSGRNYRSARISSYDTRGGNADGGQTNEIQAGETRTIADVKGPGRIVHIWVTMNPVGGLDGLRDVILRMYWDGEKTPSVEVPIGEFFGIGHGTYYTYESGPFAIGNDGGLNCFFPMPFRKGAKVTIENLGPGRLGAFYYYIDYQIPNEPDNDRLYFHAQYRDEKPVLSPDNYTILDARGRGHFVGCFMYVRQNEPGWFGEGDDMIYIDGADKPTLHGTGTEDYFCHAWGFAPQASTSRFGVAYSLNPMKENGLYSIYRFHLEDAITFAKSIKVDIEHGHANDHSDDFSTVAYWYQTEPHASFPKLASSNDRRGSTWRAQQLLKAKKFEEYRKMQADIGNRTKSDYVKRSTGLNIVVANSLELGADKGLQALLEYVGPFPMKDMSEKMAASIKQLGGDPSTIGKSDVYRILDADGKGPNVTMDGKFATRTDKAGGNPYIYFDVDDKILRKGDKPVLVEVGYYDEGKPGDTLRIEYDSAVSYNMEDRYRKTEDFVKPGKKGWNTAILYLDRARFEGMQNGGADFRIFCGEDADEYISSVKVIVKKE